MMNNQSQTGSRQDRCSSCGAPFGAEDNFCGFCGTKRDSVPFQPADNIMPPVYGPAPMGYPQHCDRCGHRWEEPFHVSSPVCPACGNGASNQKNSGKTLPLDLGDDPMPTLQVQSSGQTVTLTDGGFVIGRERSRCALALQDKSISRTHAVILKEGVTWYLCDLGSTNGTFLNRTRIQPNVKMPLNNGDIIQVGGTEIMRFLNDNASTGW